MIDLGYIAKRIKAVDKNWLPQSSRSPNVVSVWSVSNCISEDFCDYSAYWKHNGYWFFDTPAALQEVANQAGVSLAGTRLLYLRAHPQQYDEEHGSWSPFAAVEDFPTRPVAPAIMEVVGYDVVTYAQQCQPECSPLSCNAIAAEHPVNENCLLGTLAEGVKLLEHGAFNNSEPGPFRIIEVNAVNWPEA